MLANQQTFVELCLAGKVMATEVDDVVDAWHDGDDPRTLREFLGFTDLEYACWVKSPSCVFDILACRNSGAPFTGQLKDVEWGMAARSNGSEELIDISEWLPKE